MGLLNLFRGGELDGHRYETQDLLTNLSLPTAAQEYVWTPEKVVIDDRTARVWIHRTMEPSAVPTGAVTPSAQRKERTMSETSTVETTTTTEAVTKETPLLARRVALGLSRKQLAAAIGSTEAKVYRIENGGTRTTEEETASYVAGLDHLEGTVVKEKAEAKAAKEAAKAEAAAAKAAQEATPSE